MILLIYLHIHPTIRASNADGIKVGLSLVPSALGKTFISNGLSLPAAIAKRSRFSIPVACSSGVHDAKTRKTINI